MLETYICPEEIYALRSFGGVVIRWFYTASDGISSAVILPFKVHCICERTGMWNPKEICGSVKSLLVSGGLLKVLK